MLWPLSVHHGRCSFELVLAWSLHFLLVAVEKGILAFCCLWSRALSSEGLTLVNAAANPLQLSGIFCLDTPFCFCQLREGGRGREGGREGGREREGEGGGREGGREREGEGNGWGEGGEVVSTRRE